MFRPSLLRSISGTSFEATGWKYRLSVKDSSYESGSARLQPDFRDSSVIVSRGEIAIKSRTLSSLYPGSPQWWRWRRRRQEGEKPPLGPKKRQPHTQPRGIRRRQHQEKEEIHSSARVSFMKTLCPRPSPSSSPFLPALFALNRTELVVKFVVSGLLRLSFVVVVEYVFSAVLAGTDSVFFYVLVSLSPIFPIQSSGSLCTSRNASFLNGLFVFRREILASVPDFLFLPSSLGGFFFFLLLLPKHFSGTFPEAGGQKVWVGPTGQGDN